MTDKDKLINLYGGYSNLSEQIDTLVKQRESARRSLFEAMLKATNLEGDIIHKKTGKKGRFVYIGGRDSLLTFAKFFPYTKSGTLSLNPLNLWGSWSFSDEAAFENTYQWLVSDFEPAE